jgi:O-antigen ligase
MVPFDPARNIDMQGMLLIIAGGFAWANLVISHEVFPSSLSTKHRYAIVGLVVCCASSTLLNPHLWQGFFGAPYIRLGALGLLSCIGCGLLISRQKPQQIITALYCVVMLLGITALPYAIVVNNSPDRLGGVIAQASVLACFLGCGIILGWQLLAQYAQQRKLLIGSQLFLIILLVATQTRAVLGLVLCISIIWTFQRFHAQLTRTQWVAATAVFATILCVGWQFIPARVRDISYAVESIEYRASLQLEAVASSSQRPLFGYGPSNLADALTCQQLESPSLQETCQEGYFFNSSHNIFLDRFLAIGWIGGSLFVLLAVAAIHRGSRAAKEHRVLAYALLLICLYYLTNVTTLTLELLVWILLVTCLMLPRANRASA